VGTLPTRSLFVLSWRTTRHRGGSTGGVHTACICSLPPCASEHDGTGADQQAAQRARHTLPCGPSDMGRVVLRCSTPQHVQYIMATHLGACSAL
jgi:hypothetical protein